MKEFIDVLTLWPACCCPIIFAVTPMLRCGGTGGRYSTFVLFIVMPWGGSGGGIESSLFEYSSSINCTKNYTRAQTWDSFVDLVWCKWRCWWVRVASMAAQLRLGCQSHCLPKQHLKGQRSWGASDCWWFSFAHLWRPPLAVSLIGPL